MKKHLNNSYHCSKPIYNIDLYISEIKQSIKNEEIKCLHCNTLYTKKSSLDRHIKNSKCTIIIQELIRQKQIEDLKTEIEKLKLQIQQPRKNKSK